MSYPITDIDGIDADSVAALKGTGIRTTAKLLEAAKSPKGRLALAEKTGINPKLLLRWANTADHMRNKGVGPENAVLLRAAGVDTVRALQHRNPEKLAKSMKAANAKRKLVRVLPSDRAVARWVEGAKKLPLKISY